MTKFTWDIYSPHFVGLDDVFHRLDSMTHHNKNYPPYNLIKHDNNNFEIEVALAGFKRKEIEVSTESNILRVASKSAKEDSDVQYLHKGVSKRSFINEWQLSDDVRVMDVNFEDGLLKISLEKVVPDHQKKILYEVK
ncbi:heat shock protein [Synechococcus phage S-PM2]|uniref:Heat shock protein n=1 Tax=Synechococcus phage S-PM2 TaxID=238854 RepID=Q5GQK7_BPSYP|nr:Hsp20 heat shock protein [Synechococcus phage S-PM2]CAF34195.1 heat shock protein [Synechococcus phage S-PM2]CFW42312.1 heat shock protein [Synechococcus phage S-PM2]